MCLMLVSFSNNDILSWFVKIIFVPNKWYGHGAELMLLEGHLGILTATLRVVLQSKLQ